MIIWDDGKNLQANFSFSAILGIFDGHIGFVNMLKG